MEPLAPVQGKGRAQRIEAQAPSDGLKGDPKGKEEHEKAQKAQAGVIHRDTHQELLATLNMEMIPFFLTYSALLATGSEEPYKVHSFQCNRRHSESI